VHDPDSREPDDELRDVFGEHEQHRPSAEEVADALGASTASHDRRVHRGVLIAIVVGCVVVVGAVALLVASSLRPAQAPVAAPGSAATASPSAPAQSAPATVDDTRAAAGGPATGASPAAPPSTIASAPGQPAPAGQPLATLTSPPPGVISLVVTPKGFSAGSFAITMRPYGWGPGGASGGTLVVRIDSAKPLDAGAKALKTPLADKNAALVCVPAVATRIPTGGTYSGTLSVNSHGDVGVMSLIKVAGPK
jgi:hypothetical protein